MYTETTEAAGRDGVRLRVTIFTPDAADAATPARDVVLLHGWPNAGRVWATLADHLFLAAQDRPIRLLCPTFRGFGESGRPESGYTCAAFADDVTAVVASLGLTRYALVGHSMGGKIAQLVAARRPAGLAALALVCPVPLAAAPAPEGKKAEQRAVFGDAAKVRALLEGMVAHPLKEERLAPLTEDALRASRVAWDGWIEPMRDEDFAGEVGKIAVPTRVYQGAKDPLRTEEVIRRSVVAPIPGATLEVLPSVGHLPHLEEPSALALLLVNFLDEALT